jgi:hypothetical protein
MKCSRCGKPWHGPQCKAPFAPKRRKPRGLTEAETVAMAICYGVSVIAADDPGISPQAAWEANAHLHESYREEAIKFLTELHGTAVR